MRRTKKRLHGVVRGIAFKTAAQFGALPVKDPNTLYIVTE